ncbi:hypothetical protein, partial [Amnibacterium endophyticum]
MADALAASPADLDLVELAAVLGGDVVHARGAFVLEDPERTPVAEWADGRLSALRPLAPRPELRVPGVLALDDPALRTASAAVLFDALPTRSQIAAVGAIAPEGPIAWLALAGRSRTGTAPG